MEKGAKIAALLSFLAAPVAAQQILVCTPLPHRPVSHRAHHVHYIPGHSIRHHTRRRCHHPHIVCHWVDELGGPAGEEPGAEWFPENAGTDLGGGFGDFGGFGGGGGDLGSDEGGVSPFFIVQDAQPVVEALIADIAGCGASGGDSLPTPVPEPSTWLLFVIGMAATGFSIFRQRLATVSRT